MLYIFPVLLFLAFAIYIMPLKISITIQNYNNNIKILLNLKTLYGLIDLNTKIPALKLSFEKGKPLLNYEAEVAEEKRSYLMKAKELLSKIEDKKKTLAPLLRYITKRIFIRKLNLKLGMGTGDAAVTGVLYGTVWIIIGSIMTYTESHVKIKEPKIVIVPIFNRVSLSVDFSCIISIKIGHIMNIGIRAIPALISGNR